MYPNKPAIRSMIFHFSLDMGMMYLLLYNWALMYAQEYVHFLCFGDPILVGWPLLFLGLMFGAMVMWLLALRNTLIWAALLAGLLGFYLFPLTYALGSVLQPSEFPVLQHLISGPWGSSLLYLVGLFTTGFLGPVLLLLLTNRIAENIEKRSARNQVETQNQGE